MGKNDGIWEEITINNWLEFDKIIEKLNHREWLFRGQSNIEWKLKTSLYRLFDDMKPIIDQHFNAKRKFAKDKHEIFIINKFISTAHLYRNHLPKKNNQLEWLSIMQHFGAPTRLLDVTLSPHIATYFALEQGHFDCCIYAFNHLKLKEIDDSEFKGHNLKKIIFNNKGKNSFIIAYEPKKMNERLVAQQGLFLIPSNNDETFDELIDNYGLEGAACKKIIIPKELRFKGIERMRKMNITSATLFPGIDGFCKSLRFQVLESTQSQAILP